MHPGPRHRPRDRTGRHRSLPDPGSGHGPPHQGASHRGRRAAHRGNRGSTALGQRGSACLEPAEPRLCGGGRRRSRTGPDCQPGERGPDAPARRPSRVHVRPLGARERRARERGCGARDRAARVGRGRRRAPAHPRPLEGPLPRADDTRVACPRSAGRGSRRGRPGRRHGGKGRAQGGPRNGGPRRRRGGARCGGSGDGHRQSPGRGSFSRGDRRPRGCGARPNTRRTGACGGR